jgi:hypothetical protein
MDLTGSVIRSRDAAMGVLRGHIRSMHMDRRQADNAEPRTGLPRRRKPPPEVRELVGTGRLCVVKGDFEISVADAARYAPGGSLRLESSELQCVICFLSDAVVKGDVQKWRFAALFEPTPEQRRWVEALHKPTPEDHRVAPPPNAPQPAVRKLPPPPVFLREHMNLPPAPLGDVEDEPAR